MKAMDILAEEPSLLTQLQTNVKLLHQGLSSIKGLRVSSDDCSPTIHIRVEEGDDTDAADMDHHEAQLQEIASHALEQKGGVVVLPSRTMAADKKGADPWCPSLRVTVSAAHTKTQIQESIVVLTKAAKAVL
jgi:7-keto-8-aminopelargonate synthetase-like enzyme